MLGGHRELAECRDGYVLSPSAARSENASFWAQAENARCVLGKITDLANFARICARSRDGMTELGRGLSRKRARRSSGLEQPKELAEANFDQGSTPAIPGYGKKRV
jgi:hypothetical protein